MSFLKISVFLSCVLGVFSASSNTYIFAPIAPYLNPIALFDGPPSVVNAHTTTATTQPSPSSVVFYNYISASVYCSDTIQDLSCDYCQYFNSSVTYYKVLTNETLSTMALVTVHSDRKEIAVTFRGTSNVPNIISDITFIKVPSLPGIKIHAGFYLAAMSLYNQVVAQLHQQLSLNPGYSVVINGQSLGGAMASVTQFFLLSLNQFPGTSYSLYTFGQPRSGNKGYADYMNSQTIPMARVVSRADIVPHLVPVSVLNFPLMGDFYTHHQNEYWDVSTLNASLARYCSTNVYEDSTCSNSLGPVYSVVDHLMYLGVNYITCVARNGFSLATIPGVFNPTNYPSPPLPTFLTDDLINTYFPPVDAIIG